MLLSLGWLLFGGECAAAIFFGVVFWHVWSHAAMTSHVRVRAILTYAAGCIIFLILSLALPL